MPAPRLALALTFLAGGGALAQAPITVETRALVVDPSAPRRTRFGRVEVIAALELRSPDRRFGGVSGLSPLGRDRLLAVNDRGDLFELRLRLSRAGQLLGLAGATLRALPRPAGFGPFDVESIARDRDGSYLLGVEGRAQLLRYRSFAAAPVSLPLPPELGSAPRNGGLEAVTVLKGGDLLLLCERCGDAGTIRGWVGKAGSLRPLQLRAHDGFVPTDVAPLDDGGALLLERDYTRARGARARVRRFPARALRAGTRPVDGEEVLRLERPLVVDNFEGIALVQEARPLRFVIVSDDNFNRHVQRTLLFQLELR